MSELTDDLLNVNEKDRGTYGATLRAAAAERIAELEAALRELLAEFDEMDVPAVHHAFAVLSKAGAA